VFLKAKREWKQSKTGEAIEGYLRSLRKHGDPVPPGILEEVIEKEPCGHPPEAMLLLGPVEQLGGSVFTAVVDGR